MMKRRILRAAALLLAGLTAPAATAQARSDFTTSYMPYAAFDELETTSIRVGRSSLKVGFAPGSLALGKAAILAWLERSARAVSIYYGDFPVRSARILIVPVTGRGVTGGQAFGYRGAAIRLMVGTQSRAEDLTADWKAVHEMVHLALPNVDERHLWLGEGLAVYVESIARVQSGDLTAEKIWGDFLRDMPQGLPRTGDRGLDFTPTWGRRYWGGALFCLLADTELRKRTGNETGLQDAVRAVIAAGGNHEKRWPVERIFAVADKATGTDVLSSLYERMKADAYAPDLPSLWRELGVSEREGDITFDDSAPLAEIRKSLTAAIETSKPLAN